MSYARPLWILQVPGRDSHAARELRQISALDWIELNSGVLQILQQKMIKKKNLTTSQKKPCGTKISSIFKKMIRINTCKIVKKINLERNFQYCTKRPRLINGKVQEKMIHNKNLQIAYDYHHIVTQK